ncbi:hypothetical protein LG290_16625 (plasmid) [Halomonas sediminis]
MGDFRAERIGLTNAARLLGLPVTELKAAIQKGEPLRGIAPPQPIVRSGHNLLFLAGGVMDVAEAIQKAREAQS